MTTRSNPLETFKNLNEEYDFFTVPNAIVVGRALLAPRMAYRFYKDPQATWASTAAFLFSDRIDGMGAKQPWERLQRFGFRRSEFGRRADPAADKLATSLVLTAGLAARAIPRALGGAVLAQKAFTGLHAVHAKRHGVDLQVSEFGRASEMATGVGLGAFVPAAGIEDPELRRQTQLAATGLTIAGLACAALAHMDYRQQIREQLQQSE